MWLIWCDQVNLLSISMSKYLISSFSFDCSPIILMFSFMVTFLLFFQNTTRSTLRDSLFESSQLALKYCLVVLHMRYISFLRGHCLFWPLVLYYLDMIQTTTIQSLLAHDFLVLKLIFLVNSVTEAYVEGALRSRFCIQLIFIFQEYRYNLNNQL